MRHEHKWPRCNACCPHCDFSMHDDPNHRPWGVYVSSERDSDGQPTHIRVERSNGSHCAESDALWVRELISQAPLWEGAVFVLFQQNELPSEKLVGPFRSVTDETLETFIEAYLAEHKVTRFVLLKAEIGYLG